MDSSPTDPLPTLPKNFVRPALLLLLLEQPAHGYELIRAGREELHTHAKSLAATSHTLEIFLSRYHEFVALRVDPAPARRRRAKRAAATPRSSAR